jgi:hypothetical protein
MKLKEAMRFNKKKIDYINYINDKEGNLTDFEIVFTDDSVTRISVENNHLTINTKTLRGRKRN